MGLVVLLVCTTYTRMYTLHAVFALVISSHIFPPTRITTSTHHQTPPPPHNHSTTSLEQEARRLQERASTAEQRAASAEAKVELLQKAVNAAEQRVATLEMQATGRGRTNQAAASTTGTGAEAVAELELLREELASAQEAAAAATANAKTFQALASSSDEALKTMQTEHERYKTEAAHRLEVETNTSSALRAQLNALEEQAQGLRERVEALVREREHVEEQHTARMAELRAAVSQQESAAQQAEVGVCVCVFWGGGCLYTDCGWRGWWGWRGVRWYEDGCEYEMFLYVNASMYCAGCCLYTPSLSHNTHPSIHTQHTLLSTHTTTCTQHRAKLVDEELQRTRTLLQEQRNKYEGSVSELGDAVREKRALEEQVHAESQRASLAAARVVELEAAAVGGALG